MYDEVHGVDGKLKDEAIWKDFIEKLNAVGPNSLARRVSENLPKGESDGKNWIGLELPYIEGYI